MANGAFMDTALRSIDGLSFPNVTSAMSMFQGTRLGRVSVNSSNFPKLSNARAMFWNAGISTIDSLDISKCGDAQAMFQNAGVSNITGDITLCGNCSHMFVGCPLNEQSVQKVYSAAKAAGSSIHIGITSKDHIPCAYEEYLDETTNQWIEKGNESIVFVLC